MRTPYNDKGRRLRKRLRHVAQLVRERARNSGVETIPA
jgi:hypothetical protein